MKFLHLADLHLGKTMEGHSRLEDQAEVLAKVVELCQERQVDAVLVAGDIYDTKKLDRGALNLFEKFITDLATNQIKAYIIAGNHDEKDLLDYGKSFFQADGIHIVGEYKGSIQKEVFHDEFGAVNIYLLPYVKKSEIYNAFPEKMEEFGNSYNLGLEYVLNREEVDETARNIILSHQFVAATTKKTRQAGSEGNFEANRRALDEVGTIEKISAKIYAKFDYVALGHLHLSDSLDSEKMRYAGSLMKYHRDEKEKAFPLVTLGAKGTEPVVELVEIRPSRDIEIIRGELAELLKQPLNENYIYVELLDTMRQINVRERLRAVFPNFMKATYVNEIAGSQESTQAIFNTAEKTFEELASDFYRYVYNEAITDEELAILRELAEECGISNVE